MESEYIAFSREMCNLLPFMVFFKGFSFILDIHLPDPELFYKAC